MCQGCVDACREVFPEVPDEEMRDFLMGTTCFPFGTPEAVRVNLLDNRSRMTTSNWQECYTITDAQTTEAMVKLSRTGKGERTER
jgi:hypothetical protein